MDEFAQSAMRESTARRIVRRQWFWLHFAVFVAAQVLLFVIWLLGPRGHPWFVYPLCGWLILLAAHAAYAFVVRTPEEIMVEHATRPPEE